MTGYLGSCKEATAQVQPSLTSAVARLHAADEYVSAQRDRVSRLALDIAGPWPEPPSQCLPKSDYVGETVKRSIIDELHRGIDVLDEEIAALARAVSALEDARG